MIGSRQASQVPKPASAPAPSPLRDDRPGSLRLPAFVEPHLHFDKAFVWEHVKAAGTGTLQEAIDNFRRYKPTTTEIGLKKRGLLLLRQLLDRGVTRARIQVDVDQWAGLRGVRAALWARSVVAPVMDVEVVAFPQEGIVRHPEAEGLLAEAVGLGVDVLGGIPAIEGNEAAARKHVETVVSLAAAAGLPVDMHIDENTDPASRTLEMLAEVAIEARIVGRVTAGHCCAMSVYDDAYASRVIEKLKLANLSVVALPGTNLVAQGRAPGYPKARGLTRVKQLLEAGVNVALAQDSVQSALYPFGQGDPLETAFLAAHALHFTSPVEIEELARMVTERAARAIGRSEAVGDEVILPVATFVDAIRLRPASRQVVRLGRLLEHDYVDDLFERAFRELRETAGDAG